MWSEGSLAVGPQVGPGGHRRQGGSWEGQGLPRGPADSVRGVPSVPLGVRLLGRLRRPSPSIALGRES